MWHESSRVQYNIYLFNTKQYNITVKWQAQWRYGVRYAHPYIYASPERKITHFLCYVIWLFWLSLSLKWMKICRCLSDGTVFEWMKICRCLSDGTIFEHFMWPAMCFLIDWLIGDHLYSTILHSLEQTHCTRLWFYMSDTLFIARFFCFVFLNIHRSGVLKHWHGWCHMKLQPSRRKFCVHHTTMHHVTSCKATYVRCMHV